MQHFAEKYDLELAKKDAKFVKQFPLVAKRLEELERIAHPKCGLDGFDDYPKLIDRIEKLEKKVKQLFTNTEKCVIIYTIKHWNNNGWDERNENRCHQARWHKTRI